MTINNNIQEHEGGRPARFRVAIVGAGITGAVAAAELAKLATTSRGHSTTTTTSAETSGPQSSNNSITTSTQQEIQVIVFDQGRRGPGGRASHRSVRIPTGEILPDDVEDIMTYSNNTRVGNNNDNDETYQFDHGCQFFRADSQNMRNDLLDSWLSKGWVEPWKARLGCLYAVTADGEDDNNATTNVTKNKVIDFFGIPYHLSVNEETVTKREVYIGVGGMHLIPRRILKEYTSQSNEIKDQVVETHRGTRVQSVRRNDESDKWDLYTIEGAAAYHDTKQKQQTSDELHHIIHRDFDAVLFTDISSASDAWHRASAGIPDSFRSKLPPKIRIPLFSCMIALSKPIREYLPFDAFTTPDTNNEKLWFAAVSQSKPGMCSPVSASSRYDSSSFSSNECWSLISTPSFAVDEIQSTTMRDPKTGEFRPQENSYLNSIPGPALAEAFLDLIRPYVVDQKQINEGTTSTVEMPEIVYLQAQRWGSGLPAPKSIVKKTVDICGTTYASELLTPSLVYPRPTTPSSLSSESGYQKEQPDSNDYDFIADDRLRLYYAGDFCSLRNPGFESAALSGLDVARHMWSVINQKE